MKTLKSTAKRAFALLLALSMLLSMGVLAHAEGVQQLKLTGTYGQTEARSMLDLINAFRTGPEAWYWNSDDTTKTTCTSLNQLQYDYELEEYAMLRAAEIAVHWSHDRPDGTSAQNALKALQPKGYGYVGENIAMGNGVNCNLAFTLWQETNEPYSGQGHRRNMLNSNFTHIGIGHFVRGGYDYWVQVFGSTSKTTNATAANDAQATVNVNAIPSFIDSDFVSDDVLYNKHDSTPSQDTPSNQDSTPGQDTPSNQDSTPGQDTPSNQDSTPGQDTPSNQDSTTPQTTPAPQNTPSQEQSTPIDIPVNPSVTDPSVTSELPETSKTSKPAKPNLTKLTAKKQKVTIQWKRDKKVTGYEVQYASSKNFKKGLKKVNIKKNKTVKTTTKALKKGSTCYVRMRSYKVSGKKKVYSAWSKTKSIKVK